MSGNQKPFASFAPHPPQFSVDSSAPALFLVAPTWRQTDQWRNVSLCHGIPGVRCSGMSMEIVLGGGRAIICRIDVALRTIVQRAGPKQRHALQMSADTGSDWLDHEFLPRTARCVTHRSPLEIAAVDSGDAPMVFGEAF